MLHKVLAFSKLPYLIMILFFLLLLWIASGWLDIDILRSKSLDEYVFHRVILNIHEGFLNFDLRQIFSIYFYLYGFSYFFLNYLLVLPFLDLETNLMVFLPRMISTFFLMNATFFTKLDFAFFSVWARMVSAVKSRSKSCPNAFLLRVPPHTSIFSPSDFD